MMIPDREWLRKHSVIRFARLMAEKHPEIQHPVTYEGFRTIAERERIVVMELPLSRPGRLLRSGSHVCVQIERTQLLHHKAEAGMHELCHFWRDDPGEPFYNVEDDALGSEAEDFADKFAWFVTSPAGIFLKGIDSEDF